MRRGGESVETKGIGKDIDEHTERDTKEMCRRRN